MTRAIQQIRMADLDSVVGRFGKLRRRGYLALVGASGVFFCSGGYRMYRRRGVITRQTRPGTRPASAQVPQLMVDPRASLAKSTARGLAAIAVMNIAEEIVVV